MSQTQETASVERIEIRSISAKSVIAGLSGIFVELYDNAIYGFLAGTLALVFFPSSNPSTGMLLTLVAFGIPFFIRPLGAAVGGHWGDKIGRRRVLIALVTTMCGATGLIGVLPSAASIGVVSPILLVVLRFIQGFSMGAETGNGNSYLSENAPQNKRGQVVSYANAATFIAMMIGTLFAAALTAGLGNSAMTAWGWRLPFLIAFPMGLAALWVRFSAGESPEFEKVETDGLVVRNPLWEAFASRDARRGMLLTILLPLFNSSGYFILFIYMPSFMTSQLKFSAVQGLVVTGVALLVGSITSLISGCLSDRFGRKPLLAGSAGLMVIGGFPCYYLLTQKSIGLALLGVVIMSVIFSGTFGVVQTAMTELFPTRIRTAAYGFGYNIGTAIFGGAAPAVIAALIGLTGSIWVPAVYLVVTSAVACVTALKIRETAFLPLPE
ncbi:MFS transporter [Sinomonas terrae]|uniref:MFS transporter n=1 Tax=Sinomonas terrae TaxID=2908838 RepID=A0ABS9U0H6_9MICC|nr:MFS transporter [Sinomonas terrae]MCH6470179.1 MFS transporter [Sinomonas terrae]